MRSRTRLADPDVRTTLRSWLERARYEVLPLPRVVDEIAEALPTPVTITVTASASRGPAATLDVAERVAALGHRVVPHLAARQLRDEVELKEIADRLERTGIRDAFVIAGDVAEPVGTFEGAQGVLEALARFAPELEIGVAGYPETHPRISDDVAIQALWDKREYASYVVSQVCFDSRALHRWVARLRARGIAHPVLLGVPGPVPTSQLLRVSQRIGVGESLRFLSGHAGMLRVVRPGAFDPLPLLAAAAAPGTHPVDGLHVYTFNAVADTEQWRRRLLDDLEEEAA